MKKTTIRMECHDPDDPKENMKITIEGWSDMPFWKQDLAFKAALQLLQSIDRKRFFEDQKIDEFFDYLDKARRTLVYIERD